MERFFYSLECFLQQQISRSKFLKIMLGGLAVLIAQNKFLKLAFANVNEAGPRLKKNIQTKQDLVAISSPDPYKNTLVAIAGLGGMELFVKKGATVVVKPNIGWDRNPEQAANTNPAVVAALVDLCYRAGAKRVNVFDVTCNDPRRCYQNSGIEQAALAKGAKVYLPDHWNVVKAKFPFPSQMENWPILRDAVSCDTFINVPVLKHHGLTNLTLSMKNLMGVCSGQRGLMHMNIGPKLVDLLTFINPELTVIDATRVLLRNGPTGGNLADVAEFNTVFASCDSVLADTFACRLLQKDPMSVKYLQEASGRNLGQMDLTKARVQAIKL